MNVPRTTLFQSARDLASGKIDFTNGYEFCEWLARVRGISHPDYHSRLDLLRDPGREWVPESDEILLWEAFESFTKTLNCKFSPKGIANKAERRRRFSLFGLFDLIEFRSQDERIKNIFERCYGQISLGWFMRSSGTNAPPWYYRWAFDVIPDVSGKVWGPDALKSIEGSWPHMEIFRNLAPEKFNLLAVKR